MNILLIGYEEDIMFKSTTSAGKKTTRRRGSALIFILAAAAVVVSLMAIATANITQASQNSLGSSKIALQAQQYAAAKAFIVRATKYDELQAQAKTDIQNSNFFDEVIIGPEEPYPGRDKVYQKECTVNVYRANEQLPRYSLKVLKTSVKLEPDLPVGSIIPWYGNISDMPEGFALCDGKNGTPDLRDKFITGAGKLYKLGETGGENEVLLEAEQTASHYHYFGWNSSNNTGYFLSYGNSKSPQFPKLPSLVHAQKWNGSNGGNWSTTRTGENLATSLGVGVDAAKPHENRPPFYALYYIMRVE